MNNYQRFHDIIDELIEMNISNRELHKEFKHQMSAYRWLSEFCTVRIETGRRSGKTEYIKRKATESDLIIVADVSFSKVIYTEKKLKVSYPHVLEKRLGIEPVRFIYVDEPSIVFRKMKVDDFYEKIKGFDCTIVMLGTPS